MESHLEVSEGLKRGQTDATSVLFKCNECGFRCVYYIHRTWWGSDTDAAHAIAKSPYYCEFRDHHCRADRPAKDPNDDDDGNISVHLNAEDLEGV